MYLLVSSLLLIEGIQFFSFRTKSEVIKEELEIVDASGIGIKFKEFMHAGCRDQGALT